MKKLVDYIGEPALLEQTAEECMELAFACLKLARMKRGENKVWGHTEDELVKKIEEECADVDICMSELLRAGLIDSINELEWRAVKKQRMIDRLMLEDKKKEDEKFRPLSRSDTWSCSFSCADTEFTEEDFKKILGEKKPEEKKEEKKEAKKPEVTAKDLMTDVISAFLIGLLARDTDMKDDKDNRKA